MSLTITRPRRRVNLCTNLELRAAWDRAVDELEQAKKVAATDPREAGSVSVKKAAEAVAALEEQMRSHTVVFVLEAWPRKRWTEFEETHPAREGNETDRALNIDVSTLDEAIAGSIVAVESLSGEPVEFDPATWLALADEMTNGQWEDFALAILNLNRGVKAAPFSAAASREIRKSGLTSN